MFQAHHLVQHIKAAALPINHTFCPKEHSDPDTTEPPDVAVNPACSKRHGNLDVTLTDHCLQDSKISV